MCRCEIHKDMQWCTQNTTCSIVSPPNMSQMKHRLDATLCRFYFCRVTLHVSGASAHHQEYLKLVRRPLVHVLSLQVSHHISLLGPKLNWIKFRPSSAAVLVLNTPDDGRLRPKHVEWLCRNKTCTVLHQVGVSFDLYYDARKHKIKTWDLLCCIYCMNLLLIVRLPS